MCVSCIVFSFSGRNLQSHRNKGWNQRDSIENGSFEVLVVRRCPTYHPSGMDIGEIWYFASPTSSIFTGTNDPQKGSRHEEEMKLATASTCKRRARERTHENRILLWDEDSNGFITYCVDVVGIVTSDQENRISMKRKFRCNLFRYLFVAHLVVVSDVDAMRHCYWHWYY